MDLDTARHEHNMARWTFAGSAGVVAGSLILGGAVAVGLGWRSLFIAGAALTVLLFVVLTRLRFPSQHAEDSEEAPLSFRESFMSALQAMKRPEVLRWLILLEFSNLMLDILYGYLALYFVDVVHIDEGQAALAVSVWTVVGLLGDLLLIPLLERVRGVSYLRVSAVIELILFPAFLLVPGLLPKLVIIGALGFFNSGWYAILQGNLYSAMPNQSGAVLAISNISGIAGGLIPLAIGVIAERFGLDMAMWAMLLGPIALLIGLPRTENRRPSDEETSF
jgi:FSR family fosmidomycin resistance protein-like MFS transporter